jgi:hypothetical protein
MQPILPDAVQVMRRLVLQHALASYASMLHAGARSTFPNMDDVLTGTTRAAHTASAAIIAAPHTGANDFAYHVAADIDRGDQAAVHQWMYSTTAHDAFQEVH